MIDIGGKISRLSVFLRSWQPAAKSLQVKFIGSKGVRSQTLLYSAEMKKRSHRLGKRMSLGDDRLHSANDTILAKSSERKTTPAFSNKKVLVVRFDRGTLPGFVQAPGGFGPDALELLTPQGSLTHIPYSEVKAVCFVRDFSNGETWLDHRAFSARPKSAGLWVRLRFRDGDSMEGMLANDLLLLEPAGFSVVPPDPTFQNQRIFVPRAALSNIQVLGVIGSPLKKRVARDGDKAAQINLFEQSG